MFQWLTNLWEQALAFLSQLFAPVWDVISAFFHLLVRVGELLVLAVEVAWRFGQLVLSVAAGVVNTLIGLLFAPQDVPQLPWASHGLGGGMQLLLGMLDGSAWVVLAPVLSVGVWLLAGWAVLRIAGAR